MNFSSTGYTPALLTMVKIKVNVQDAVKLLSQFVNSKDNIIDVTESLSLISRQTNLVINFPNRGPTKTIQRILKYNNTIENNLYLKLVYRSQVYSSAFFLALHIFRTP
jgi:hypothetical protein